MCHCHWFKLEHLVCQKGPSRRNLVSLIHLFDPSWLNCQSFAVRALALAKSQASPYANPNTDNAERYIDVRLGVVCVRVVHGTAQFDEQHFEVLGVGLTGRMGWTAPIDFWQPQPMAAWSLKGIDKIWQNHVMLIKILSFYLCMHAARQKWRVASQNNLAKLLSVQVDPTMLPWPCRTRAVFLSVYEGKLHPSLA